MHSACMISAHLLSRYVCNTLNFIEQGKRPVSDIAILMITVYSNQYLETKKISR